MDDERYPRRSRVSRRTIIVASLGTVAVAAATVVQLDRSSRNGGPSREGSPGTREARSTPPSGPFRASAPPSSPGPGWAVVWEDGFDSGSLDESTWTVVEGSGQTDLRDQHVNDPAMVDSGGNELVLTARREPANGFAYRAGSITTKGKRELGPHGRLTSWQYLTRGTGVGVGVCLFGQDIDQVGWPACGEIDATEIALGRAGSPFGSIHGPGYSGGAAISGVYTGPLSSLADRWVEHVLDWNGERITWAIDGTVYQTANRSDPRAAGGWPFDQPCFLQLFVTVGSYASGAVDTADWPEAEDGVPEFQARFDGIRFEQWRA